MKSEFSTSWTGSRQVRKQRKYRYNSPLHIKHRFLSANLSKELRKKHGKRSVPLRKGDEVLVMRGSFKKKKGKIDSIDLKRSRIIVDGINKKKKDGSKVRIYLQPSNLQITSLSLEDKERIKKLGGREEKEVKTEKKNAPKQN